MSYRNPQIIVDRSGEIWGQAIGKFGQDVSRGIEKYAAVKAKNQELARKKREANQLAANGVSQKFLESIEKTSAGIKDSTISQQFKDTATMMANTGEEMTINGKSVTMGAIEAQTELRMNPNLDKETRNAYSKIVSKFKSFQSTMVSSAGNIISGLEGVSESTTGQIGKKYDFRDEGFGNTQSQIATYSLLNKQIPGVNSDKIISREKGEDGETKNMLTINSSVDTESDTYKNWEAAGLISKEDLVFEEGSTVGTFSWKRDLATWGEEGGLITEMSPQNQDSTESMKIAGFIDDKGNATGKGFNNNAVYTTRTVKGGTEKKSESHFDPDSLRDDPTYEAELRAGAAGILAMPLDQQEKFITNTLGWPTITREKWSKISEEKQTAFLMEQRFENDLQKIMGEKGKKKVQTRDATQEDVDQYAADGIEISLLNPQIIDEATGLPAVDENGKELPRTPTKLYYTTKGTSVTADPKVKNTKDEPGTIKTPELIESIFADPGIVMAESGIDIGSTYDEETNTLKLSDTLDEFGDIVKQGFKVDLNTLKGKLYLAQAVIVAKEGKTKKSRAHIKSAKEEIKKRFKKKEDDEKAEIEAYGPQKIMGNANTSDAKEKARLKNKYFPNKK